MIDVNSGQTRALTTESTNERAPRWSHDGRWIYFHSDRSGREQVWTIPAEGGPATRLTRKGGREAFEAPDGRWLYYTKLVRAGCGAWA